MADVPNEPQRTPRDEPVAPPTPGTTALYRFFDSDGLLLYVGITSTTDSRWSHHRLHAAWWPQAATKQVEWFTERGDAAAAELEAIRTEAPLWNSAAAPASNARLKEALFVEATNGGIRAPSGEWRNSDVALAQVLSAEIRRGVIRAGQSMPSIAALTRRFGVTANTARRALMLLVEDRLVTVQGSNTVRRYFAAVDSNEEDWRPPPLPDGRDALDALLEVLRESDGVLSVAATRIGLHLSVVRGWGQRHPRVARMMEEAAAEGSRRAFVRRTGIRRS